jgi:predicted dehydrogenase
MIGCGERGEGCCKAITRTANTRLAMMMDANPARCQDLSRRFGVPWTTELEEVLASDDVDAVVISTPHHLHAQQAVRAAEAGKHIVVEKPIATSLEEAVNAVRAARAAGVHFSVNFSYRYGPLFQKAKALIEAGVLGELFGVSLTYQKERFVDYWEGHTGRATTDWRMRRETSGGGVLINIMIHYLDLLRYLPGRDITEVSCVHANLETPGDVEDAVGLWVRYENGAVGTVSATSSARGTDLVEFQLWGRDGHLSLTPPYQFYSLRVIDGKRPGQWHAFTAAPGIGVRDVEFFHRFAERVLRGNPPDVSGEDGLAAQAIVEAAYRSAETGRTMQVPRGPWTRDAS